ncbi:MAG: DciA family protein [Pseudomonadota bacterium]|nr:DciA family protein [Pseudomonadota bacterium]
MSHRNYTKYPVKISTLLPKVLKPLRKTNSSLLLELKMNWEKIIGSKISEICFVSTIKKINKKNILIVVSDSNKILELSYSSNEIKNKVNSFFNSNFIDEIKFKKSLQC